MNENNKSWKLSLMALVVLTALAAVSSVGASLARAAEPINFGVISTESSQNLSTVWEPFIEDMKKDTGLDIRAFFATDYAGIIEAMRFNKVQLAWYGGKAAMEAVDRAEGEVFVQTVDADGNPGYYSHIIANVKSPINSIEDMLRDSRSLNFGNGDPNSTSGFLVPAYYVFALNKVDPKPPSSAPWFPATRPMPSPWPTISWTWPPATARPWNASQSPPLKSVNRSRLSGPAP